MQMFVRGLAAALLFVCLFQQTGCSRQQQMYLDGIEREVLISETMQESEVTEDTEASQNEENEEAQTVGYVYVCGSVCEAGVYPVHEGMRIFEAIHLAGGFAEGADEEWLNQAEYVSDGQRIYVYSEEETMQMKTDGKKPDNQKPDDQKPENQSPDDQKININTADKDMLMTLAGIGEAKADAIIQYRDIHGSFRSIEEIQNIPGIKHAVFSKIKDKITV